jgi:hypothetical protein
MSIDARRTVRWVRRINPASTRPEWRNELDGDTARFAAGLVEQSDVVLIDLARRD